MTIIDFLEAVHADHVRLGFRSGNCAACTPGASWHADARAGCLRPAIVGGVPIEPVVTTARSAPEPRVSSPRLSRFAGAERAALAAPTG